MTEALRLLIGLLCPVLIGYCIINVLFSKGRQFFLLEKIFMGYGLGFGYITLSMFYLSIAGIKFNSYLMVILAALPILTTFINAIRKRTCCHFIKTPSENDRPKNMFLNADNLSISLLILSIVCFALVIFRTMSLEKNIWDSWAFWAFKAKIYFYHKIMPLEMLQKFKKRVVNNI